MDLQAGSKRKKRAYSRRISNYEEYASSICAINKNAK